MKSRLAGERFVLRPAALAAICVLCATCAQANLLTNESFELGTTAGWTVYSRLVGAPTVTIQTASPASGCGTYYLYINNVQASSAGGVRQTVTGLTAGATYRITGSKRSMHTADLYVTVKCDTNGGTDFAAAEQTVSARSIADGWTTFSGDVTATGTSMTVFLDAETASAQTSHVGAFDCISMSFLCMPPAVPTGVAANPATIFSGQSSTLTATPPSGCVIDWYKGSCGGTFVGTGSSLVVTPTATTTYYARARNTSTGCYSATCASATVTLSARTVTITPSNMSEYGWQMATSNGGGGVFTKGGPATGEYAGSPTFPAGEGAFYMTCDEIDTNTPSTVWLGLDKLYVSPGVFKSLELVRLNQIKKIVYKTYAPTIPALHFWDRPGEMNYVMQPVHVAIATAKNQPPGYLNRRWYVNMPWPYSYETFHRQDRFGHWDINQAAPWDGTTAGWYNASLHTKWDKWEDMVAVRGTEVLVPTSTYYDPTPVTPEPGKDPRGWKSAGYDSTTSPVGDHPATGTGTAINFYVGARKSTADLEAWYGTSEMFPWWLESYGFRGYIDEVTIGVEFDDIGYVETTYDFEPEADTPDTRTVTLAQLGATLPTTTGVTKLNEIMRGLLINKGYSGAGRGAFRVQCTGRVLSVYTTSAAGFGCYFDMTDGSVPIDEGLYQPTYPWENEPTGSKAGAWLWERPLPVRVHVPEIGEFVDPPVVGEYWSATGYPVVLSWDHPIPAGDVTEVCGQLNLYSNMANCRKLAE